MCTVARTNTHTSLFLLGFLSVPGRGEELQWVSRRLIMPCYEFRYSLSALCNMFTEEMTHYQLTEVAVPSSGISA